MKRTGTNGFTCGLVLAFALPVIAAQDPGQDRPGRPRAGRAQPPGDRGGERGRRMRGRRGRGLDMKQLQAEMQAKLELKPEQQQDVREMIAEYEKDVKEANTKRLELFESRRDEMTALREKMIAARESGDPDAVTAAREEMRALFAGGGSNQQLLQQELIAAIEEVLDDAQREKFKKIVQDLSQRRGRPVRLERMQPAQLLQAAKAAKIAQEKRDALATLTEEFEQARKEVDRSEREAMRELYGELREHVQEYLKTLTAEEREAMTKAAGEMQQRRGEGRGRPGRERRGQRGARPQPEG